MMAKRHLSFLSSILVLIMLLANHSMLYSQSHSVWMEAENGAEYDPMIVKSDTSASQQIYLASWKPDEAIFHPPADGHIIFTFEIEEAGFYRLWARAMTPDTLSGSYWIRMDLETWIGWENIGPFPSWGWKDADSLFQLSEGEHTLIMTYRERDTRLDKILLTDDLTYVPSGQGEPVPRPEGFNPYRSEVVDTHGHLQIIGTHLCNKQGIPVQLKGLCTHGIQWFPLYKDLTVPNAVESMGIEIIRPAMYVEAWYNENDFWNGYMAHPDEMKMWEMNMIEDAIEAGIYVVIDWHIHSDPTGYTNAAADFFTEMSQIYGNYPNILYDISNEAPEGINWSTIKLYSEQIITVIRENDPDDRENIIIVGTPRWCQDVDIAANDPITGYNNLTYALHFYAASHNEIYREKVKDALYGLNTQGNNLSCQKIPLFISEFGTTDYGAAQNDFIQTDIWFDEVIDVNMLTWINWSLGNKDDASSMIKPTSSLIGPWDESDFTESGDYITSRLSEEYLAISHGSIFSDSSSILDTLYIYSSLDWEVTADPIWIHVTPNTGSCTGIVVVAIDENITNNRRDGSITISGQEKTRKISVIQTGKEGGSGIISIYARGNCGSEIMTLMIDEKIVQSWTVSRSMENYTYRGIAGSHRIQVGFSNDGLEPCDRNLFVDYIDVNGFKYQTEICAARTGCGDAQWLWCSGYFDFGMIDMNGDNDTQVQSVRSIAYHLFQNYPNPFNPKTHIRYEIPEQARVTIEIYNPRGEKIRTLTDKRSAPGMYDILWNATDDQGKRVPGGLYIYRMTAVGSNLLFTENRKMLILK
ncbi:cellulase family glycosylhydrolase [bacterium]|nr:cellulase family glycosylhydrolase [bacterium]